MDDADLRPVHAENALPIEVVFAVKAVLQGALSVTVVIGVVASAYLYWYRDLRARIYGPLATGLSQMMMFVVNGALIIVALMQIGAITLHDVPCVVHSALSTALVPICGTAFLLRAWVLVVQFARVREQLRWMALHRRALADASDPLPWTVRVDFWLSTHRRVSSAPLLAVVAMLFALLVWVPSIAIEVGNACDHEKPNDWNDFNVWLFCGLALALATRLRGRIDTIGVRRELKLSAFVIVAFQILQMLVEVVEERITFDAALDADALEDEYHEEVAFSMWYIHTWATAELLTLVVLVMVRPAAKLFRHQGAIADGRSSNEKMRHVLNNRNLREAFQDFLLREFSIENLAFYDAVQALAQDLSVTVDPYLDTRVTRQLERQVVEIYTDFVSDTGRFQINLSSDCRRSIEEAVRRLQNEADSSSHDRRIEHLWACRTALENAKSAVFDLMATDSLPRFLRERQIANPDASISGTTGNNSSAAASSLPVTVRGGVRETPYYQRPPPTSRDALTR